MALALTEAPAPGPPPGLLLTQQIVGLPPALGFLIPPRLARSTGPVLYVDQSIGSDANTRTQAMDEATPWATVEKALATAIAGDRIQVKNGTYFPTGANVKHQITTSGTAQDPITLEAYPGHRPVIRPAPGASGQTSALHVTSNVGYWRIGNYIDRYTPRGNGWLIFERNVDNIGNNQCVFVSGDAPTVGAHHIELVGFEVRNSYTASLVYVGDAASRVDQIGLEAHHPEGYRDTLTTITAGVDAVATTFAVASGTGFANNDFVRLDDEIVQITAGGGTASWTVLRGQKQTLAAAHSNGVTIAKGAQHHALYQTGDGGWVYNCFVHDMPQSFGLQNRTNQAAPGESPVHSGFVHNTVCACRQDYGSGPGGGTGVSVEGRANDAPTVGNIVFGNGNRGIDGLPPSGPSAPNAATNVAQDAVSDPVPVTFASVPNFPTWNGYLILIQSEVLRVVGGAGTASLTCARAQLGSAIASHTSGQTATLHEANESQPNPCRKNIVASNATSQLSHSTAAWRINNFDANAGMGGFTFGTGPGDNLVADPLFRRYQGGIRGDIDPELQPRSPAIGFGLPEFCPDFDFYGRPRYQVDAGAFAYVPSVDGAPGLLGVQVSLRRPFFPIGPPLNVQPETDWLSLGQLYLIALEGSITPAGSLTRDVGKGLTGATSPTGAIAKLALKTLAGAIAPAGALSRLVSKLLGGSVSPIGALKKQPQKGLGGSVSPAGALQRLASKLLAGAISPGGGLAKLVAKLLGGSISPAGALALAKVVLRSFAGAISPSGLLSRLADKRVAGATSPSGALARQPQKGLGGSISPAGALARFVSKGLAGAIAPVGVTAKLASRKYAGAVSPAGALAKQGQKGLAGAIAPAGAVVKKDFKSLSGAIAPAGSLAKSIGKKLAGAISPAGSLLMQLLGSVFPVRYSVSDEPLALYSLSDEAVGAYELSDEATRAYTLSDDDDS